MARWDASRFSGVSLYAVIASPAGRGNPVGDVMWDAGTMRGLPYATAGLPRQADAFLAMTTGGTGMGEVGRFPIFESITPNAVIASPLGRGNPV